MVKNKVLQQLGKEKNINICFFNFLVQVLPYSSTFILLKLKKDIYYILTITVISNINKYYFFI